MDESICQELSHALRGCDDVMEWGSVIWESRSRDRVDSSR